MVVPRIVSSMSQDQKRVGGILQGIVYRLRILTGFGILPREVIML